MQVTVLGIDGEISDLGMDITLLSLGNLLRRTGVDICEAVDEVFQDALVARLRCSSRTIRSCHRNNLIELVIAE